MTAKIGFIGAGKVGYGFGRHITERGNRGCAKSGFEVAGYVSRDKASACEAAAFAGGRAYGSAAGLAAESDLLLLTVPDGAIAEAWRQMSDELLDRQARRGRPLCIGHCSGSLGARVFGPRPLDANIFFGSIHPLAAIYDRTSAYKKLDGAFFTTEGDEPFAHFAGELLSALGNPFREIDAAQKTLYHAASVMVSNLVCALAYAGTKTFKACGLDDAFAESAWRALFLENAENIAALGPVLALTGPVERADAATAARHLEALSGDERESYLLLSRILAEAAQKKNPSRDYSEMKTLLK
ncbi:MAG: DUF2520 domain-containing protein [Clostridiales Family XIII bacterium]|jgi:predicted short-subunit dehydrogenase-like oxidoreductase (DUF2520 family)|nr:DUF2520 domain-containing protein [Clostridiales Family XIII bacterium]